MSKNTRKASASERAEALMKSQRELKLALCSYVLTLLWAAGSTLYQAPPGLSSLTYAVAITFFSAPLLVFAPWLWKGNARSWVWFGYVLLFYLVHAAVGLFAPGLAAWLAAGSLALVISTFVLGARFVKFKRAANDGEL